MESGGEIPAKEEKGSSLRLDETVHLFVDSGCLFKQHGL